MLNVTPIDRLQLWSHGPCFVEEFFQQGPGFCISDWLNSRNGQGDDFSNQWGCLHQLGFEYVGMNHVLHVCAALCGETFIGEAA